MNVIMLIALVVVGLGALFIVVLFLHTRSLKHGSAQDGAATTNKLVSSLRDEKLKSNIILNTIEDGVMLLDEQQNIRLFNPGAAKITGWSMNDANGLTWSSVIKLVNDKGEPIAADQDPLTQLQSNLISIHDNHANLQTKSGKTVALDLVLSPIVDEQKHFTGAVAVLRDVTETRKEEQKRAEFISTASHEMRTPVAAIEGYLALAMNDRVSTIDSRAHGFLDKAHASTQHLGQLFQDLLTSAKAEDGRLTNHPQVVEFGAYLEQITSDVRFSAEKKGLSVEFAYGASKTIDASKASSADKFVRPLYYTYADPDRLREVITNLFDNAVKYTDSGKISFGLTGNDQVVQFFIRDTGIGIPPEDVPHMFQKFYRVDNSATRTIGGTGLGLFICRKIVELYGGRIWVDSKPGEGSTFYINLPRLSNAKAEELKAKAGSEVILKPITSLASPS